SNAHYTFSKLTVNDQDIGTDWQYIRQHTKGYMPNKIPDILTDDFRCQPGSFANAAKTEVYEVKPGDHVQFKMAFGANKIEHPGSTQVYFSKAPNNDVKSYQGDGDWVKAEMGLLCSPPENGAILNKAWCAWDQNGPKFIIPDTLEAGEYLVRGEHIAMHGAHDNGVEFYFACAQLKVTGTSATGIPGDKVKIPGVYQPNDPAIHFSIWNNAIKEYTPTPGPAVMP
ncbi:glycoside hydrolase family 61 protein, partial [Cercospora zeae-maydis SCOH1-5]